MEYYRARTFKAGFSALVTTFFSSINAWRAVDHHHISHPPANRNDEPWTPQSSSAPNARFQGNCRAAGEVVAIAEIFEAPDRRDYTINIILRGLNSFGNLVPETGLCGNAAS
jgi:hypothetical protein